MLKMTGYRHPQFVTPVGCIPWMPPAEFHRSPRETGKLAVDPLVL